MPARGAARSALQACDKLAHEGVLLVGLGAAAVVVLARVEGALHARQHLVGRQPAGPHVEQRQAPQHNMEQQCRLLLAGCCTTARPSARIASLVMMGTPSLLPRKDDCIHARPRSPSHIPARCSRTAVGVGVELHGLRLLARPTPT